MDIRKVLTNELLSKELSTLDREKIIELVSYVTNMFVWCLNFDVSVCREFTKSLSRFVEFFTKLRFMKYLLYGHKGGESVDEPFLEELEGIIKDYYRCVVYGLVDSNGNVMVKVLKDFEHSGIKYSCGSATSLPFKDALLLARVGYVKLLDELIT